MELGGACKMWKQPKGKSSFFQKASENLGYEETVTWKIWDIMEKSELRRPVSTFFQSI